MQGFSAILLHLVMDELEDTSVFINIDWDPVYLASIFDVDFHDTSNLWDNNMTDQDIMDTVNHMEKYCPVVEDISIEDEVLCSAVEQIESE